MPASNTTKSCLWEDFRCGFSPKNYSRNWKSMVLSTLSEIFRRWRFQKRIRGSYNSLDSIRIFADNFGIYRPLHETTVTFAFCRTFPCSQGHSTDLQAFHFFSFTLFDSLRYRRTAQESPFHNDWEKQWFWCFKEQRFESKIGLQKKSHKYPSRLVEARPLRPANHSESLRRLLLLKHVKLQSFFPKSDFQSGLSASSLAFLLVCMRHTFMLHRANSGANFIFKFYAISRYMMIRS